MIVLVSALLIELRIFAPSALTGVTCRGTRKANSRATRHYLDPDDNGHSNLGQHPDPPEQTARARPRNLGDRSDAGAARVQLQSLRMNR